MSMSNVGIVIGGASCVWIELEMAQQLCRDNGVVPTYFACNDMIEHFSKGCVAVTLHVEKLPMWLANRAAKGFIAPRDTCICTKEQDRPGSQFASRVVEDWGGSVGLFAIKCAWELYGIDRIILCGVPLEARGGHFVRQKAWNDVVTFEHRWIPHLPKLKGHVKSFSGKTREWFGEPTPDFVMNTGG